MIYFIFQIGVKCFVEASIYSRGSKPEGRQGLLGLYVGVATKPWGNVDIFFGSMAKSHEYSEVHLNIGFTTMISNDGIEMQQCVLGLVVLSTKTIKPKLEHTVGETLIQSCKLKIVKLILREANAKKNAADISQIMLLGCIFLFTYVYECRKLGWDGIKAFHLLSFQLDQSTDASLCSQLLVFVRYG